MFGAHLRIGDELTTDPSTWAAVVDGRSSILFATLAGVSMALLSGRTHPADGVELVRARLRIAVRAAWVFAIGAVLEWLDTFVAIILGVYAVLFVLALPFLRWPPRRLLVAAGVIAVAGPPLNVFLGQVLSVADAESALRRRAAGHRHLPGHAVAGVRARRAGRRPARPGRRGRAGAAGRCRRGCRGARATWAAG